MLNKPSNVCQRRLCSNRFDHFHFKTFLNYGKLLESVVFHSGRWGYEEGSKKWRLGETGVAEVPS